MFALVLYDSKRLFLFPIWANTRIRIIYDRFGISSVKELKEAVKNKKIRNLPGFGEKIEKTIIEGIEQLGVDQGRRGWLESEDVLNTRSWKQLKKLLKRT